MKKIKVQQHELNTSQGASLKSDAEYLNFEKEYLINYGEKAAKNGDEEVPIQLWDRYILRSNFNWLKYSERVAKALETLRNKIGFRWFLKCLRNSLFKYLRAKYGKAWWNFKTRLPPNTKKRKRSECNTNWDQKEFSRDIIVGRDAVRRATWSSWWEWNEGSSCFFWRWPAEIRNFVRDGFPVHIEGKLPRYKTRQVFHLDPVSFSQLEQKVTKVIDRGYVEKVYVSSLIGYFAVPKGEGDIRLVYDATKCGLNSVVWAPNFYLPSVDPLLMSVSKNTWFSDMDLGEMFLNYFLDEHLRSFAGVDVSKLVKKEANKT